MALATGSMITSSTTGALLEVWVDLIVRLETLSKPRNSNPISADTKMLFRTSRRETAESI